MFKGLKDFLVKEEEGNEVLKSPFRGKLIHISKVPDSSFSDELVGKGVAVLPIQGYAAAPMDGIIDSIFKARNGFTMKSKSGVEILVHIGLDTAKLNGEYFEVLVDQNQPIKQGDKVIKFNLEELIELGYNVSSPILISNSMDYEEVNIFDEREVDYDDDIIEIKH